METQDFFSTLKETEHAAAKVEVFFFGLLFPVYDTVRTGSPHAPVFRSMVEVGEGAFQGQEAKTNKQAEMNATNRLTQG
ncbi:hypothetical protein KY290_028580 [Solanum tuberosum]|uniref:Uncharacterized protein n=1 Tax=Solanum tuberosum TaxID=4113 RepID=A0ABQ7UK69_SOLTU|nr:hypothetical protein KY290_028580 [Solanum tuberosum]